VTPLAKMPLCLDLCQPHMGPTLHTGLRQRRILFMDWAVAHRVRQGGRSALAPRLGGHRGTGGNLPGLAALGPSTTRGTQIGTL
jgi:hypothetical protein